MWRERADCSIWARFFDAVAAPDLAVVFAGLLQDLKRPDQFRAAANQGIAGAVLGSAAPENAPGNGFGNPEDVLQGAAVDPFSGELAEDFQSTANSMKICGSGGHQPGYHH